ncbi:MAG: hypothetical protein HFG75_15165 [Hungatella sp.]|nr:hypothetical protein [Hungatella sp.]
MILGGIPRELVADEKLWKLICRANELTDETVSSWDSNAPALIPLLKRILAILKEEQEWKFYFFVMNQLFYVSKRNPEAWTQTAFWVANLFHQDMAGHLSAFEGEGSYWKFVLASNILLFYLRYPQIDDKNMERMLLLFQEQEHRCGYDRRKNNNYHAVMDLALFNRDVPMAETARRKLEHGDYEYCCYACFYGRPMIGYYVLHEDFEGVEEIIRLLCEKSIPINYRKYFDRCVVSEEKDLVGAALLRCLKLGRSRLFERIFRRWGQIFGEPGEETEKDVWLMLFHGLAGDWSWDKEGLQQAALDDRNRREQKVPPLNSLYQMLCWYCCFRMLDARGSGKVRLESDDIPGEGRERTFPEAAEYFEQQADLLGGQMDRARKRFGYQTIKTTFETCFWG